MKGIDMLTFIVATLTLLVTIFIPIRIEKNQSYGSLISDYRSYDFAAAIQGVINFFVLECGSDFSKIQEKYEKRYEEEIEKKNKDIKHIDNSHILHYQRRMLNSFFYQLDLCSKYGWGWRKRIQRDFTVNEAHLLKIIFYMNKAVDESSVVFKDISNYEHIPKADKVKGMNSYIADLYSVLKKSSRHIK